MKLIDRNGNDLKITKYIATDSQVKKSIEDSIKDGSLSISGEQVEEAIDKKIADGILSLDSIVKIDDTLNNTSENAVQNKVIKAKFDELESSVPKKLSELEADSTHRTVTDEEKQNWNNKSDFSGNYNDLTNKPTIPNAVTVDSELDSVSTNPVQNKVVKAELDKISSEIDNLKNVSDEIYEQIAIDTQKGFWAKNSAGLVILTRDYDGWTKAIVSVVAGEKYKITGALGTSGTNVAICYLTNDSDDNRCIIQEFGVATENVSFNDYEISIPEGCTKMYVCTGNELSLLVVKKQFQNKVEFDDLTNEFGTIVAPMKNKTIVNFGDSIFGKRRPPEDISTAIANLTGATVHNIGFGGCKMGEHVSGWDAFCMYRIAYAVANNDFSIQDAVDLSTTYPNYFTETLALLKTINFNKVDIVTIAYGTNDFTGENSIDSDTDKYDCTTFGGALRYSIEQLLGTFPHLKIFICGQTYRFWIDESNVFVEDSDTKVFKSKTLVDFVAKTQEIAEEYKLNFIDNYYSLGINKQNRLYYFNETDGTHHKATGTKLIGENIGKYIISDGNDTLTKKLKDKIVEVENEKVNQSGWTANKVLGTDANGNVVVKDVETGTNISVGTPEYKATVDEMTDQSKVYLGSNGNLWAYQESQEIFMHNAYSPDTALFNYRLNSSGANSACDGLVLLDYQDVVLASPYIVKIRGVTIIYHNTYNYHYRISYYDSSKTHLGSFSKMVDSAVDGEYSIDVYNSTYSTAKYVRISIAISNVAISKDDCTNLEVEFTPKSTSQTIVGWKDTGIKYANYDMTDEDVDIIVNKVVERIDNEEIVSVPSYWQTAIDSLVDKMKIRQANGNDTFQFIAFADIHALDNVTNNHGVIAQKTCEQYDIPFVVSCGDNTTGSSLPTYDDIMQEIDNAWGILSVIDKDRLIIALGNHDGNYGDADAGEGQRKNVGNNALYNAFFKPMSRDSRRVYGGNGTYFYLDYNSSKSRIVVLNAHTDGDGSVGDNGRPNYSAFYHYVFGTEQLAWIENEALDVPYGWNIIFVVHPPLIHIAEGQILANIIKAYNDRTNYTAEEVNIYDVQTSPDTWGWEQQDEYYYKPKSIDKDFSTAKGEVVALFKGHEHKDIIDTTTLDCPIVSLTTASANKRDTTEPSRVAGTITETAMDIVTIDRKTRTIYMTRLGGIGADREVSY